MTARKIIKRAFILLAAMGSLLLIASGVLVYSGLRDDIHTADAGLVPGNTVLPDGRPSARLQARLDQTLELYREGRFGLVIASGGIGKEGFDEAAVMKNYLVAHGIPAGQVITDNAGATTYDSAKNTRRILDERKLHSVLVVSQYFHIPRTKLTLKKFEIDPVYSAHARYFEWRDFYSIPRELFACVEYWFRKYDVAPQTAGSR